MRSWRNPLPSFWLASRQQVTENVNVVCGVVAAQWVVVNELDLHAGVPGPNSTLTNSAT